METEEIPQLGETPVKIIHLLSLHQDQSPLYKQLQKQNKQTEIQLAYLLPEKLYKIPSIIQSFYKTNERIYDIFLCLPAYDTQVPVANREVGVCKHRW